MLPTPLPPRPRRVQSTSPLPAFFRYSLQNLCPILCVMEGQPVLVECGLGGPPPPPWVRTLGTPTQRNFWLRMGFENFVPTPSSTCEKAFLAARSLGSLGVPPSVVRVQDHQGVKKGARADFCVPLVLGAVLFSIVSFSISYFCNLLQMAMGQQAKG